MSIDFGRPFVFLLIVPLVAAIYLIARASLIYLPENRRRITLALRGAQIALLIATLADPQMLLRADRLSVVFLMDVSDSISPAARQQQVDWVREALHKMGPQDEAAVVAFGRNALVERPLSSIQHLSDIHSVPGSGQTNVAAALRLGMALLPNTTGRRLVLLSDGNETIEEAREQAKVAAAGGVEISVVPLSGWTGPEVLIKQVEVPSTIREGESFSVKTVVESNRAQASRILLLTDGQVAVDRTVELQDGINNLVFAHPPADPGFHRIQAELEPTRDTLGENNSASAYAIISGPPKVLIVEGGSGDSRYLVDALKSTGLAAEVRPPGALPRDLPGLLSFDSVTLVDVPATSLMPEQMQALDVYVREFAGGLAVVGGDHSFGVGGYARTPLEEMLPVRMGLRGKKVVPSVALMLVLDRSGSMGMGLTGLTKMDLAKQAAIKAIQVLSEQDQLGVVSFDDTPKWVVEPQNVTKPEELEQAIQSIPLGGGTAIYPAVKMAYDALVPLQAKVKHIILLTDGIAPRGDYEGLARSMKEAKITLSSIAIGSDADVPLLQEIAALYSGRYYDGNDPFDVPQLLVKETQEVAKSAIVEETFTPLLVGSSPILNGIDLTSLPQLRGYVATTPKPSAQTSLLSPLDDPLLTEWQYGLGRVVVWASDVKDRWASNWLGWQPFARFWTQLIKRTFPSQVAQSLQTSLQPDAGKIRIGVEAQNTDKQLRNFAATRAVVWGPNGNREELKLDQAGPGYYQGTARAESEGAYLVEVLQGPAEGQPDAVQTRGVVMGYSAEYRELETNAMLLKDLVGRTGGRMLSNPAEAFVHDLAVAGDTTPVWPWLAALALLLVLADVAARRLRLSPRQVLQLLGLVPPAKSDAVPIGELIAARLVVTRARVMAATAPRLAGQAGFATRVQPATAAARPRARAKPGRPSGGQPASASTGPARPTARLLDAKHRAVGRRGKVRLPDPE